MNTTPHPTMQPGTARPWQAVVAAGLMAASVAASAASVSYSVTDLPDTGAADLWQADYTVSGPLAFDDRLEILFDQAKYSDISVVNGVELLFGPLSVTAIEANSVDPTVPGNVAVSSFAGLSSGDSVVVNVTFNWAGPGQPGSQLVQPFAGATATPTFMTMPSSVPEAGAAQMMLVGLLGVAAWVGLRRRHGLAACGQ